MGKINDDERPIRVSFCPQCKSRDVKYVFGLGNLFGVMPKMKCFKCGYTNSVFPILVIEKKELKNKGRRKNVE